jgi:hypothetical protein
MWTWGSLAVACSPSALTGASCGAGGQCIPAPPASFEAHTCVLQPGTGGCSGAGFYSVQRTYYGGAQDTRGCSACTCNSTSGVDCNAGAQVVLWATSGCDGGASLPLSPLPAACSAPAFTVRGATFTTTPMGSCTPVGGQATGSIVPQNPVTICCTP